MNKTQLWDVLRLLQEAKFNAERLEYRDVPYNLGLAEQLLLSVLQEELKKSLTRKLEAVEGGVCFD